MLRKLPSKTQLFTTSTAHQLRHISHGQNIKRPTLVQLLQNPSSWVHSFEATKCLHAFTTTMGSNPIQPTIYLHNTIITKYMSFGNTLLAELLFDQMPQKNAVSYNIMVSAYCHNGYIQNALPLFLEMRCFGLQPTEFTFGALFSCDSLDVFHGLQLQALVEKCGLVYCDEFVGTSLLGMYGRHGLLEEAVKVFENMRKKSLVTWNNIITLFGQHGYIQDTILMFRELMRCEIGFSESTFVNVLSSLAEECDTGIGKQVHGIVIKYGLDNVDSVANCLIKMYAKCLGAHVAEEMFEGVEVKDIVSWNTIIGAMVKNDRPEKAIEIFLKMCVSSVVFPNETTFATVLNSCTCLKDPLGEFIHAKILKRNLESDTYVGSALVDFYAKCDKLQAAHHCFSQIYGKNSVCWNTLILGYSNSGSFISLLLLKEMMQLDHLPSEFSFSAVLKSSSALDLKQLHSLIIKFGYSKNKYLTSALIASYARNGLISEALIFAISEDTSRSVATANVIAGIYNRTGEFGKTQELFSLVEEPDVFSWNILIAACSRNGDHEEVFELFEHMRKTQVRPDNYTYVSLFSVCTKLCNLGLGSSLHGLTIKMDFSRCDTFVCNIMIDMYGKCGSLKSSLKIFNEMAHRNVISWTVIVSVLGLHGYAHEALQKFREMEMEGFKPDKVAFIAVLSACRHVGLVNEGMELFEQMKLKYDIEPEMDHYHLAVDLLAKCGHLNEAEQLMSQMPFPPNVLIWRSFFQGCKNKRAKETLAIAV